MKKGFTLLELMVVIIILGVLATLGVMQYQAAIEKSRGAEARQIIGQLRSQCAALYMERGTTAQCTTNNLGIGVDIPGPAAGDCAGTHFFAYNATPAPLAGITFLATRCTGGGKTPDATVAGTLQLVTTYTTGADDWTTTGGY